MDTIQPALCVIGVSLLFGTHVALSRSSSLAPGWRESVVIIGVVWGACIAVVSELLSLGRYLGTTGVIVTWLLAAAATLMAVRTRRARLHAVRRLISAAAVRPLHRGAALVALTTVGWLVAIALIAWIAAPGNWDSQTYHLSRVMHWLQNGSLDFYATHILRQLYLGPGAEILVLHAYVLGGGDRLVNFVQYAACLGSLVGVSQLAKLVGGGPRAQLLAVVVALSIPMGILQATSTQNDYVIAFWLVSFLVLGLTAMRDPRWQWWILAGAALGLAILTKATSYLFAGPFVVWIGLATLKRSTRTAVMAAGLAAMMLVILNGPQYRRNLQLFGSILGPATEAGFVYRNALYTPAALVSNVTRNLALHAGVPRLQVVNGATQSFMAALHNRLGLALNDPRITWSEESLQVGFRGHEDFAGNPLHVVLGCIALAFLWNRRVLSRELVAFAACVVAAGFLFCWVLKWQPWNSRLHLPLFVMMAPLIAVVFERLLSAAMVWLVALLVLAAAAPLVFENETRPLLGPASVLHTSRTAQYFVDAPDREAEYRTLALFNFGSCRRIGLIVEIDQWEYPLWALTRAAGRQLAFDHVAVGNESASLASHAVPCAVIAAPATAVKLEDTAYSLAAHASSLGVFLPARGAGR